MAADHGVTLTLLNCEVFKVVVLPLETVKPMWQLCQNTAASAANGSNQSPIPQEWHQFIDAEVRKHLAMPIHGGCFSLAG